MGQTPRDVSVGGGSVFQDEAVGGAAERQRRAFALGDFADGLAAIEFGGFTSAFAKATVDVPEGGQVVTRHVPAALAGGVAFPRRDGESGDIHGDGSYASRRHTSRRLQSNTQHIIQKRRKRRKKGTNNVTTEN